jgi:ATP-dependent RNA helicase DeaD
MNQRYVEADGFKDFGIDQRIIQGISRAGYSEPTEVQSRVIPALLSGKNVVVQSKTGTGKTASFAIPILNLVSRNIRTHLVLAPTRELAEQVADEFNKLGAALRVRVVVLIGGVSISPQISALRAGFDVVVGTPGRILDHVSRGTLSLNSFKSVIVDEGDRMLDMGFIEDVDRILKGAVNADSISLFSATVPFEIEKLATKYAGEFELIRLGADEYNVETISHYALDVYDDTKDRELERVLQKNRDAKTLIFTATKRRSERVAKMLRTRGYYAAWINGDLSQAQRDKVLSRFRSGQIRVLVATDVAARGLDVDGIQRVINYDVPMEPLTYVHRTGRTGRMGRSGVAVTLVSPRDRQAFSNIEVVLNRRIPDLR